MVSRCAMYYSVLMVIVFGISGCKTDGEVVKDYVTVKQQYIAALEELNPEWGKQYHLAVIPPLAEIYMPGTPLMKDSFEPLTDSCLVPEKAMAIKKVADPPTSTATRTFNTKASLPSLLKEAVKQIADLNASVKYSKEAQFSYSDLVALNPRWDVLNKAILNPKCLSVIAGKDIILIRGLIMGKETIFSTSKFGADANVKFLKDNAIEVKYDSSGGYEVKDERSIGRFWIVGEWRVDISGLTPGAPEAERKATIEDFLRTETTKMPFPEDKVKTPSLQTIKGIEDRALLSR